MAKRIQRKWVPYPDGSELTGARIIRCRGRRSTQILTFYEIEWLCCGKLAVIDHRRLFSRIRDQSTLCGLCSRKANAQLVSAMNRERMRAEQGEQLYAPGAIRIPPPGIAGIWMPLGKLGFRYGDYGTALKIERETQDA